MPKAINQTCLLICLLCCATTAFAGDCLELVQKHYAAINQMHFPKGNEYLHMKFTQSTYLNTGFPPTVTDIEILTGEKQTRYYSDRVTILKDEQVEIVILHDEKLVVLKNAVPVEEKGSKLQDIKARQKEIFRDCTVSNCDNMDGNVKVIDVSTSNEVRQLYHIRKMKFEIDPAANQLNSLTIYQTPDQEISHVITRYKLMQYTSDTNASEPVMAFVFNNDGRLTQPYKGFEILDTRE